MDAYAGEGSTKNWCEITVILLLCFLQNEYMKDDFFIKIETWHKPDLGTLENVSFTSGLFIEMRIL